MNLQEVFTKLKSNAIGVSIETTKILIKIADNILKDPSNPKYKVLMKKNALVSGKILAVPGGKDALSCMGFIEDRDSYIFNPETPLGYLEEFKTKLAQFSSLGGEENISDNKEVTRNDSTPRASTSTASNDILENNIRVTRIVLPPYNCKYTNPFLRRVEQYFHDALVFDNKSLHQRARSVIPMELLTFRAIKRLRWLQQQIKQGATEDPDIMLQDFLILELVTWFKNSFFTWVDNPDCETCSNGTKFSHMAENVNDYPYATRVELHKCLSCGNLTPFPRYNDLNILLETRKGRCGEWAKTFCLLCRALKWDVRFIVEESDHVWAEVYSSAEKRWIHCDPCEGICDKPLMYETGWGKKISYVMAYSAEEVQDVTWRYTSRFKEVLSRRKNCSEAELIECIMTLRTERQKSLKESRRKYLTKRLLVEMFDFLEEKHPSKDDAMGRTSGALDWRLSRGETQPTTSYTWSIVDEHVIDGQVTIKYSTSLDKYLILTKDGVKTKDMWSSGVFYSLNIFRKEERDWKQAYLARTEGSNRGEISWKFKLEADYYQIEEIDLYLEYTTFENGKVEIDVTPNIEDVTKCDSGTLTKIKFPSPSEDVKITAVLTGGKGDIAWQHAQLFRQPLDSESYPFVITLKINDLRYS